jgi:hypothetical protein
MRALSFILGIERLAILRSHNALHLLRKTRVHLSFSTPWFSNGIEIVHFLMRHPYVWTIVLDCLLSHNRSIRRHIHSTRCIILPIQWHKIDHLLLIIAWILMGLKIRLALYICWFIFYWHSAFLIFIVWNFLCSSLPESFDLIMSSWYS